MATKTNNNAPAVIEPRTTDLAELLDQIGEFAPDGAEDLQITFPSIKLIQGTTRGIAGSSKHIGEFYHEDTGEYEDALEVIPLYMQTQRALFEEDLESPSCMSVDGAEPLPNQPLWRKNVAKFKNGDWEVPLTGQPRICAACPLSQFAEDGTPPVCGETILMMVQRDDESFARLRIGRTGLKPVRDAAKKLQYKGKRLPIFTAMWTFRSFEKEAPGRKWSQLEVSTAPLSNDEIVRISKLAMDIRRDIQTVAADTNFADEAENVIDYDEVAFDE